MVSEQKERGSVVTNRVSADEGGITWILSQP